MAPTGPEVSNRPNSEALSGRGNWQGLRDRMCIIISGSPSWNFYYTPISRGVKGTETKHKNKGFHWHLLVFVTVKTTYKTEVINNCSSVLQKIRRPTQRKADTRGRQKYKTQQKSFCFYLFKKWTSKLMYFRIQSL